MVIENRLIKANQIVRLGRKTTGPSRCWTAGLPDEALLGAHHWTTTSVVTSPPFNSLKSRFVIQNNALFAVLSSPSVSPTYGWKIPAVTATFRRKPVARLRNLSLH